MQNNKKETQAKSLKDALIAGSLFDVSYRAVQKVWLAVAPI